MLIIPLALTRGREALGCPNSPSISAVNEFPAKNIVQPRPFSVYSLLHSLSLLSSSVQALHFSSHAPPVVNTHGEMPELPAFSQFLSCIGGGLVGGERQGGAATKYIFFPRVASCCCWDERIHWGHGIARGSKICCWPVEVY